MSPLVLVIALDFACCLVCDEREELVAAVIEAFAATHDGWSADEVILNDDLNTGFIAACRQRAAAAQPAELNWMLLNLRKAGKLSGIRTTRRNQISVDGVEHIAEIVSRSMMDRHRRSIDRILTDPSTRSEFDRAAKKFNQDVDGYLVRRAAFQLRKTRRLQPELITRIADWGREVSDYSILELRNDSELVPERPGVYIFRDESGYLYIGQSDNLRERLATHLNESSNLSLTSYLASDQSAGVRVEIHAFAASSRAKEVVVRRAYESELIRSRKPRFNILP